MPGAPNDGSAPHAEMTAAREAMQQGRLADARRHVNRAESYGDASIEQEAHAILRAIDSIEAGYSGTKKAARRAGMILTAVLYLGLLSMPPSQWTLPVWAALAFGAVPIVGGAVIGAFMGSASWPSERFRAAWVAVGAMMALYTLLGLSVTRSQFHPSNDPGQLFLVGCMVILVYSMIAGVVAGVAARIAGQLRRT